MRRRHVYLLQAITIAARKAFPGMYRISDRTITPTGEVGRIERFRFIES